MKPAAVVLVVLALVATAYSARLHATANARAEAAEARADSLHQVASEVERLALEEIALRDVRIVGLTATKDSALNLADRAAHTRPAVVTRIVQVAGDSAEVLEAVAELVAAYEVEVSALRTALAIADSIAADERESKLAALNANAALRAALDASRTEAQAWEASASGLFGFRIPTEVAFGAGVLLGVVAITRMP